MAIKLTVLFVFLYISIHFPVLVNWMYEDDAGRRFYDMSTDVVIGSICNS